MFELFSQYSLQCLLVLWTLLLTGENDDVLAYVYVTIEFIKPNLKKSPAGFFFCAEFAIIGKKIPDSTSFSLYFSTGWICMINQEHVMIYSAEYPPSRF